ncbi:transporter substrate-binding protein [Rhizobium sp. 9140]|uniref:transporter substrate-binding protein n=1 Tax=Rhizobium sp. 9140 TaxID=1761900 RepID=UPI00079A94EC|nr:transporter substrate-binding protein [Rhizobium sp. 9140]CZT37220.1 branched-chain amino acid transport system substrate-binding protein [Rhizobium sp. 9140]
MSLNIVPVSILYSTTGPYAAVGREAVSGAMAAVAEINSDPAYGFSIAAKIDDPCGRAEAYASLGQSAIRNYRCRHVIGTLTSWSRKDLLPVVERNGALLWYAFPYEGYEASDSVVYLGPCPNQHLLPLFDYVLPRHGRRPFIVGSNYIWGWEISRIAREITEASGGQVVADRYVPLGSTEVDHLVTEIQQKKPDFILSNLVGQSATAFIEAYGAFRKSQPDAPPIVACNLSESDLDGLSPEARCGHVTTSIYFDRLETPENRVFKTRMAARQGAGRIVSTPFMSAYMAMSILARSIADAGSDAPEAVRSIATSRLFDTPVGPIGIDPRTHHAAFRPHLGLSDEDGGFTLLQSANEVITADPYLVRSLMKRVNAAHPVPLTVVK